MSEGNQSPFPQLTIIVGSMIASLIVFVAVGYVVAPGAELAEGADSTAQVLAIVGVLPLGLSSFIQRQLMSTQHRSLTKSGGSDAQWTQAYTTGIIVGSGLREATGIFGLVITFLTGEVFWVGTYAAIAAVGLGLGFPTPERYDGWRRTGA